jgi:hypothetical protein
MGSAATSGRLALNNQAGNRNIFLGETGGRGILNVNDADGGIRVIASAEADKDGYFELRSDAGNSIFSVNADGENDGAAYVRSRSGQPRSVLFVSQDDDGFINLRNKANAVTVLIGSNDASHAFINLRNAAGTTTVGMDAETGQVWGSTKNFRIPHPTMPDHNIVYTSIEGPEVSLVYRGKATLEDGEAFVELPEHFQLLAVPGSLSATVTPMSRRSLGLGVETQDDGFTVFELHDGRGSYEFSYTAFVTRTGYEDFPPVQRRGEGPHIEP